MATVDEAIDALRSDIFASQLETIRACPEYRAIGIREDENGAVVAIFVNCSTELLSQYYLSVTPTEVEIQPNKKIPVRSFYEPS